jgi:Transcriptional regulator, AbiEi antitoxin
MSAPAPRAMAEFAASRHGAISRSMAASFGFTPRNIYVAKQSGWLSEPTRGVLVVNGYPPTWEQQLAIVIAAGTARPVVSDGAAARLFGLDDFSSADGVLTVLRPARLTRAVARGIIVHQTSMLESVDRFERDGLPCTSLARTLTDLGSRESTEVVWRALISARRIHRVNPLWLQQTAIRLHRPGQHGSNAMIQALHRWSAEGTLPDSWFEELVRCLLVHPEIPEIVAQYVVTSETGRFVARVDLGIPAARLGIEAHSRRFHFGPIREAADEDRDLRAAECGWELIYLGWYAQRRPVEVAQAIAKICQARVQKRSA